MSGDVPGRVWTLRLPYLAPPLTLNQRFPWQKRYRVSEQIKSDVGWLLKAEHVAAIDHASIELIWTPRTVNRRDSDNVEPTRKAAIDAIVKAGLLPDDSPEYVTRPEIRIEAPNRQHPSMLLVITELR